MDETLSFDDDDDGCRGRLHNLAPPSRRKVDYSLLRDGKGFLTRI